MGTFFIINLVVIIGVEEQAATREGMKEGVCCCWEGLTRINLGLMNFARIFPRRSVEPERVMTIPTLKDCKAFVSSVVASVVDSTPFGGYN